MPDPELSDEAAGMNFFLVSAEPSPISVHVGCPPQRPQACGRQRRGRASTGTVLPPALRSTPQYWFSPQLHSLRH
jgi:hypothetical protein